jgi:DNA-binding transcriptional MocR family regulator
MLRRALARCGAGRRPLSSAAPRVPKYGQYFIPTVDESVNFQVGQPAPSMLPLDKIREAATAKLAEEDPLLLQYGYISGYPGFRKALARFLTEGYGHQVSEDNVFATTGVTGGMALICSLFVTRGDLVFAEEPSYFLALSIFKDFGLNVKQIPMEEDGMNLDALEARLKQGEVPKFVYTIPTAHNPTGRTLSAAKRERLCALSREYGFNILADEVYHLLTFPHVKPPPPMCEFDAPGPEGTVMSLGSFSKILAPAMRLGWIQSNNPDLLGKLFGCGQLDSSGGMNPVMSAVAHQAIDSGLQQEHLAWTKDTLWERAETLMRALDETLPEGCSYEVPDGGYFVLVRLPEDVKAVDVLEAGKAQHKVQFLPGANFAESMQNYLRLSFSYYDAADLAVGAQRVGDAVRDVMKTVEAKAA